MKVLIDTSVWSLVFRRKSESDIAKSIEQELRSLIKSGSVELIGAIRQEILSGISSEIVFKKLVIALQEFSDLLVNSDIHVKAAECFNICRSKGIQGSHTDFLICAVSIFYNIPIFTLDKDFENYKKYLPISLHDYLRINN
ncbi:MAG: PIN domain-containing protein [Candidatus Kapabacteria bacterium]|nr:PIN domain-containing protein [Candidatus Kapabacteria bacterium]